MACIVALLAPPAAMAADAPAEARTRLWSGYVHLSPMGGTAQLVADPRAYIVWGLAAGYHFLVKTRLAVESGFFFEHGWNMTSQMPGSIPERVVASLYRFGAELRFGRRAGPIFGYGLARVGAEFSGVTIRSRSTLDDHRETRFLVSVGGGFQAQVGRRFVLGGEPAIDVGASSRPMPYLRARVFFGGRF